MVGAQVPQHQPHVLFCSGNPSFTLNLCNQFLILFWINFYASWIRSIAARICSNSVKFSSSAVCHSSLFISFLRLEQRFLMHQLWNLKCYCLSFENFVLSTFSLLHLCFLCKLSLKMTFKIKWSYCQFYQIWCELNYFQKRWIAFVLYIIDLRNGIMGQLCFSVGLQWELLLELWYFEADHIRCILWFSTILFRTKTK